jgi:hypothetical protein
MSFDAAMIAYPVAAPMPAVRSAPRNVGHRRISPDAGRALEILGHAIEYLTDEFVHAGGLLSASDPQLEAMQLLMAFNRQIYFACPEVPALSERLRALFRWRAT